MSPEVKELLAEARKQLAETNMLEADLWMHLAAEGIGIDTIMQLNDDDNEAVCFVSDYTKPVEVY